MSAQPQATCHIRALLADDLPEVLAIECSAYDFPWSEGIFRDCLRVGYHALAACDARGRIMGYALLSQVLDDAHVLNLCVAPRHRRRGVAGQLLEQMIGIARHKGADTLMLEVRPSNRAAIALYQRYDFHQVDVRRRYYPARGGREDALMLARAL